MGRGDLGEVLDGSGYPLGGPGWVGGPSGMAETFWETLREVHDGSETSGTDRGTLGEFCDRLWDPRVGRG